MKKKKNVEICKEMSSMAAPKLGDTTCAQKCLHGDHKKNEPSVNSGTNVEQVGQTGRRGLVQNETLPAGLESRSFIRAAVKEGGRQLDLRKTSVRERRRGRVITRRILVSSLPFLPLSHFL